MIDTHCHFDFPPFANDPEQALLLAHQAGVDQIIIPTIGQSNWNSVAELCRRFGGLYYGLGIHPFFSKQHSDDVIQQLSRQLEKVLSESMHSCVAVGECGLDFAVADAARDQQIDWLREQLLLANKFELPVILHCRKAFPELLQLLRQHPPKMGGVYHGFSGSYQQATRLVDLGIKIGVGGTITYSRAKKTCETIAKLPLSSLILETDAPDMPVSGYQGEPNRPERLVEIMNALVKIRTESREEIAQIISLTSAELFQISV